ncbi:DNA polymerase III, delta subunit [Candidatus Omnitrophus magneticus]|uniref:DNA polymerase III subunit delta n=1 Tax=Candidatus Omnitrophus magneticus TaxID=1609969 RepID=A0A0F0CVJ4_9BACT|nr:DNA polymerase III, delta subunit [Candidatus Omnitrophus magneticus]
MKQNFLVIGDDKFLRAREIKILKEKFLSSEYKDFNYSEHPLTDITSIKNSIETLPFLSEKRVVLILLEDIDDSAFDQIISYLEKPLPTTIIILSSDEPLKKTAKYKKLSTVCEIIEASQPAPKNLEKWIHAFLKNERLTISDDAIELLIELKGTDTYSIKLELEKLASFMYGSNETITRSIIEKLTGSSITESVFKLADAINNKDAKKAFKITHELIFIERKHPTEIIGYLAWYFKTLSNIKLLLYKGITLNNIAFELKYSTSYIRILSQQSQKYSITRLFSLLKLLFESDRELKTGVKTPELALEMFIAANWAGKL